MKKINLTLRRRMLLIFVPVLILMGVMGAIIIRRINTINDLVQANYNDGLVNIERLSDTVSETLRVRERLLLLHNSESLAEQQRQYGIMNQHIAQVSVLIDEYVKNETQGEFSEVEIGEDELIADFNSRWDDYVAAGEEVAQLTMRGDRAQANVVLTGDAQHKLDRAISVLLLIRDVEDNAALDNYAESQALYLGSRNLTVTLTIAAIVIGVGLAYWLSQTTGVRLADLSAKADAIAGGDLDQRINVTSQDEVGVLGKAFNSMAAQVHDSIANLEKRVSDRTRAIETSSEISRRLSTILDPTQLTATVVEQLQSAFNYYHAHIYLYDDARENLMMVRGTGEAGQTMLARGHKIPAGKGLVGRTAVNNQATLVSDVTADPDWLPNPLLPDTKAEAAVPIALSDKVLGVLDVQHNVAGGLDQADIELLESIASQVAIALQNADLFTERVRTSEEMSKFKLALERSPNAVFMTDKNGTIIYVNPGFEKVYGFNAAEAIGQTPRIFKSGLIPPEQYTHFWQTLLAKEPIVGEIVNKTKDGRQVTIDASNNPIVNEEGQLVGFLGLHSDITERKGMETALADRVTELREAESTLAGRVAELDLLNEIGRYAEERPPIAEFMTWVSERLWKVMPQPKDCRVAITYETEVMGAAEAVDLPNQIVEGIRVDGELLGRIYIAYPYAREFQDEESALIGAVGRRVSSYIETQHLITRIQKQALDLQIVAALGTAVATTLDVRPLLQQVVDKVKESFGLYHAHIYLMDETSNDLVLAAGAGEIGQQMVAEQRRIPMRTERSLVARAARNQRGVLVKDVHTESGFLPHPLLPNTHSEMAVPMIIGEQVVGVLDVQAEEVGRFTENDIYIQTTLASQVAVALQNAQQYEQTQKALNELSSLQRIITREGWESFMTASKRPLHGYVTTQESTQPIVSDKDKNETSENESLAKAISITQLDGMDDAYVLPVEVRGTSVGRIGVRTSKDKPLPPENQALLASITEQVAEALERARLFETTQDALDEAKRQSEELALINRVVSEVSASLDLQESLQIVATELAQAISVEQVAITLLNEARTEATVVAEYFGESEFERALGVVFTLEGNQLTQQVIDTRQPVIVPNAQSHPLTAPIHDVMRARGTQTLAVLPMIAGNEVIGTVGIDILDKEQVLHKRDIRLAETLMFQAATAVQNAKLFAQTETALAETEALYQASAELNTAHTYEEVLAALRRHTLLGQDAQNVSIDYFEHPWTNEQVPQWAEVLARISDLPAEVTHSRYLLTQFPLAERFLHINQPVAIEDVLSDTRIDEKARALYGQQFGAKSAIFVPLLVGSQQVGYINAIYQQPATFPEVEQRRLMVLARQASVAVQSIRLLEETRKRAQREQLLREISEKVRGSADVETIMRTAVKEVGRALGRHAFIYVSNEEPQTFETQMETSIKT